LESRNAANLDPASAIKTAQYLATTRRTHSAAFIACLLTTIGCAAVSGRTMQAVNPAPHAPLVIGGIGDSIMAGFGLGEREDPLTRTGVALQALIAPRAVAVVNQAVLGATTRDWVSGSLNLTTAKAAFVAAGVRYVMIMLGANDAAVPNMVSPNAYRINLSSCVTDLVSSGYTVLLHNPTYIPAGANSNATTDVSMELTRRYHAEIDSLINNTRVLRGDTLSFAYFRDHPSEAQADQTHPTSAGAAALGFLWAQSFVRALPNVVP
jgi:lysophospholipase L1-like esterase